jgi:cytochrome b561
MRFRNTPERYGAAPIFFHWATVILVVLAWTLGIFGDDIPRGEWRNLARFVHVSAGSFVFILLLARLAWRIANPPPPTEATPLGPWLDRTGGFSTLCSLRSVGCSPGCRRDRFVRRRQALAAVRPI